MKEEFNPVKITSEELESLRDRLILHDLLENDYDILAALTASFLDITIGLEKKSLTIKRLQKMLFGHSTEKSNNLFNKNDSDKSDDNTKKGKPKPKKKKKKRKKKKKGHGRNGASKYPGADRIRVKHQTLNHKDPCPECLKGKVYLQNKPRIEIRITGGAPLSGKRYECDAYRCNLCNKVFKADLPEEAGKDKYDETVASTIGVLKYGSGLPFNRLAKLQESVGVPVPASTQWDIVDQAGVKLSIGYEELIRSAAQGNILHNDDTPSKILSLMEENSKKEEEFQDPPLRKGMFTTGIISIFNGHKIAIFNTGRKHAGENLAEVLSQRDGGLDPPIQMCDALSRNIPKDLEVILAHCNAHSRRRYADVAENFPAECKYVLDIFKDVYKHDATAKEQNMSPEMRLAFHQEKSKPLMDDLHKWCKQQFAEKKVEENSGLGEAITYMLKHWERLTLFLQKAGAPIDNNITERALKKSILHRKNSLFFKTENGAHVGDIYMSLIHTCNLCNADPFKYLTALQKHYKLVYKNPQKWMPWNYEQALLSAELA